MRSMITGYIAYTLKDKDGRVLRKGVKHFNSFVKNFLVMIETMFKGEDSLFPPPAPTQAVDVNGNPFTLSFPTPEGNYGIPLGWRVDADAGDRLIERGEPTDWGILVGSDDSPTTINFYSLVAPYPHGKGEGYMNYLSTEMTEPEFDGTYVKFTIRRLIINEADVSQLVREVGLVAREYYTWRKFLLARDVLTEPISMPPKSLLDVTIVIAGVLAPYNVIYTSDYAVGYGASQLSTF
ncbi:MAG: hypothetical protein ACXQTI_06585 [Candidatus Nezhaarchaeales archaeon]